MSQFKVYFLLGLEHILDTNGIDHILFVIVLTVVFSVTDWRRVLWLITAFTLGHSVTLALSSLEYIEINPQLIETLIPVTILITAFSNIYNELRRKEIKSLGVNYFYALFFGLIHGLGFSNYFKSLLGKISGIIYPLLAFNIGLEIGQIVIISLFLIVGFLFLNVFNLSRRTWLIFISAVVALKAVHLVITNFS